MALADSPKDSDLTDYAFLLSYDTSGKGYVLIVPS